MKTFLMLLIGLFFTSVGLSQALIQGTVTDGMSEEPIIFGTVALYQNDSIITATETDFDGFYSISEIDPGIYDVVFMYTGYMPHKIVDVQIIRNVSNKLDAKLINGGHAPDICVKLTIPIIHKDDLTRGFSFKSSQISKISF
ncbi:MAG: carboxypeptidase-like regulatory domain-containing protein [Bacteroidota bacterium]